MSYTPTNWQSGDIITSAKLNKMEQGIANGGGVLLVTASQDETSGGYICDKTGDEVKTAFLNGLNVILYIHEENQAGLPNRMRDSGGSGSDFPSETWMLLIGIDSGSSYLEDEIVRYTFWEWYLMTRLGENDYLMDDTYLSYYYNHISDDSDDPTR